MAQNTFKDAKTAELVNGATYTKESQMFGTEEAMIIGVRVRPHDQKREGMLYVCGFMPELVVEGTESFADWKLSGRPARIPGRKSS